MDCIEGEASWINSGDISFHLRKEKTTALSPSSQGNKLEFIRLSSPKSLCWCLDHA